MTLRKCTRTCENNSGRKYKMRINHNIAALNTSRQLNAGSNSAAKTWKNYLQVFASTALVMTLRVLRSLKNAFSNPRFRHGV